jgi:hypothetical protein
MNNLYQTELGEVSTFAELISVIWSYGSNVIVALAIFLIVLGAFFMIASAGNEERVQDGKELIFGSITSLLIVLFSGVLIRTLHKPAEGTAGKLSEIPMVIQNTTNILISLIGAFSIVMLIASAFIYMTAHGNKDRIKKAHTSLKYSLYGLAVGLLAYTIVNTIIRFLI